MSVLASVQGEVPENHVFPFNIYSDERLKGGDLHEALQRFQKIAPAVFWTPENGGHWVVTRYDLMEEVCKDYGRFSAHANRIPRAEDSMVMIPLNLDPPDHNYYRTILLRHFGLPSIKKLEPRVQHWAQHLVDNVADKGKCEFMDEIGSIFPVSVFMEMMGLDLSRLREYRGLVLEYFSDISAERWMVLQNEITRQMREVLDARLVEPQDDMISRLQRDELNGRTMTMAEMESLTNQLFQAGMDTVANFAGFFFRYLAINPDIQREIRENPVEIPNIIEEGFRLLGVVNNARLARVDTTIDGVNIRAGDMVVCMLPLAGMDDRLNPNPAKFEVNRQKREHMLFSKGVHLCIGHTLARAEMRILVTEWFKRIPEFRIAKGYVPDFRAGQVMGLGNLELEWD